MKENKTSSLAAEYRLLVALGTGILLLCAGAASYFDLQFLTQRPQRSMLKTMYFLASIFSSASLLLSLSIFLRRGSWPRYMERITFISAAQLLGCCLQLLPSQALPSWLMFGLVASTFLTSFAVSLTLKLLPTTLPSSLDRLIKGVGLVLAVSLGMNSFLHDQVFGLEAMLWSLALSLSWLTLCFPPLTAGLQIYFYRQTTRLETSRFALRLWPWQGKHRYEALFLSLIMLNAFSLLIFFASTRDKLLWEPGMPPLFWGCLQISPLFTLFWSLRTWYLGIQIPRRLHTPYLMEQSRAGQLFRRYWQRSSTETRRHIGYRTAILIADHDPQEDCRSQLPAFLYRARHIQCEQMIKATFRESILSMETHASQITLALDNSHQSMTCTQALLILSVLHIDGLRIIENRLRLLAKLFPLLDPDLSEHINPKQLDHIFTKLSSFYYLDYNWIDQTLYALGDDAYLDVRLEKLNLSERQSVLNQLRSAQWLGNFIWVSEAAYERLRVESPFIAPIIESIPIRFDQLHMKKGSHTLHLLKFENLIPRLQRYFKLEQFRERLASIPVPEETQAVLNNLRTSLEFDGGKETLDHTLREIEQHDFVGFKAKDAALELLLQVSKKAENLYLSKRIHEGELEQLFQQCKNLVQFIGYPSQDLHQSHLHKLEIREYQLLLVYGRDPHHPRCHESWLFLSSLPERKLQGELGRRALDLVKTVIESPGLSGHSFILRKATETFFVIARAQQDSPSHWRPLLDPLARLIIRDNRKSDLAFSFMDQKVALDQSLGQVLALSTSTLQLWAKFIEQIQTGSEYDETQRQTLQLRWRSFSQGHAMKLVS